MLYFFALLANDILIGCGHSMVDITRALIEDMGQTGAGIHGADEIDETLNNDFVNKWRASFSSQFFCSLHSCIGTKILNIPCLLLVQDVKPKAPWYFEIRGFIDERPNLVPTGLGNSQTEIDPDIVIGAKDHDDDDDTGGNENMHVVENEDAEEGGGDNEEEEEEDGENGEERDDETLTVRFSPLTVVLLFLFHCLVLMRMLSVLASPYHTLDWPKPSHDNHPKNQDTSERS